MATSDYITNLLQQYVQKTANPHDIGEMTTFYYDRQTLDEALKALRVEIPKSALKDLETFEKWLDGAFE